MRFVAQLVTEKELAESMDDPGVPLELPDLPLGYASDLQVPKTL